MEQHPPPDSYGCALRYHTHPRRPFWLGRPGLGWLVDGGPRPYQCTDVPGLSLSLSVYPGSRLVVVGSSLIHHSTEHTSPDCPPSPPASHLVLGTLYQDYSWSWSYDNNSLHINLASSTTGRDRHSRQQDTSPRIRLNQLLLRPRLSLPTSARNISDFERRRLTPSLTPSLECKVQLHHRPSVADSPIFEFGLFNQGSMASLTDHTFAMFPPTTDPAHEFGRYPEQSSVHAVYTTGPMNIGISAAAFNFQQQPTAGQDAYASSMGFVEPSLYAEAPNYMINSRASPGMYTDESDMRLPSSSLSTASAPSAASSAIGSPQSNHGHMGAMPEWAPHGLGVQPAIVNSDYMTAAEFTPFAGPGMEELSFVDFPTAKGFVDPSLIHPEITRPPMGIPAYDTHFQQPNLTYPASPSASSSSPQPHMMRTNSSSPFLHNGSFQSTFPSSPYGVSMESHARAPSMSQFVPPTPGEFSGDESNKEKQRCSWPDCGKIFKDLKAHMLTHQNERPEKCPIQTCEYHIKGFARKYDKNRHTLTHYKGTMVCGFCPGSGSAAEKSFNRADVFKRHLTAVHGVEQSPPNSRKKSAAVANAGKKLSGYAPDATGKCSTCSQMFSNAQDFYEHLDECVLRIVQQEDPAEAINAKRLAEVENDKDVHQTLEKNNLPTTTEATMAQDEDEEVDTGDEEDTDNSPRTNTSPPNKKRGNPANGVQKSRGVTHSRGGVALTTKSRSRKNRRDYPSSWGFDKGQMTMKKRVMAVFDGPRRLAKDDMMLSTDHEVRIKLSDGKSYVTDLDVQTLKRAAGFHGATEEEKGPWISDDPSAEQITEMQQMLANNTAASA
ncbi:hypothetical protein FZEAL_2269 [Fusarium zealandicum]|uniref:C2H2-type domain-containing protein n=1 Tax=Fusarium zealandicum TaxID=1053134 RepID=A0A8H4UQZ6_9HYPO|nr:hypothetical protein FZEAL_2269 [Fusarium zealandicum]